MSVEPLERAATAVARDGRLTIEPVRDLHAARAEWTRLAQQSSNVFGTWEWADAWHRHIGSHTQLALAIARRADGSAAAVLPTCVVRGRPVRVVRFLGAGPGDQLGPICAPADQLAAAAALRRHVGATLGDSGLFLGERLWGDDPLGEQLGGIPIRRAASPVLRIDGRDLEQYLASQSRNFRSQWRRRERRVLRTHRVRYRLTEDRDRLESDMQTLMRLHAARWPQYQSGAFSGRRRLFHLEFAGRALENGWLRLWTLELDGRAAAAWYGLRYGGIDYYYQAGRDPAFDHLNVGFVLLCHSVRCAFEDGIEEYRFGLGDEPYKARFADRDPGLDTIAIASGAAGRLALAAIRVALAVPPGIRRSVRRLARAHPPRG